MQNIKIIGHRGAAGLAPENTIASFKKALEFGADGVEFDLRVTKDKLVLLHHNRSITDASGNKLLIAASSYTELSAHKPNLASLAQAIALLGDKCQLYIEIKPGEPAGPIIDILREHLAAGLKPERLWLGSFSQKILLELHAALPQIEIIVIESWSGVRARWRAKQLGTKKLSMNQRWLWSGFIKAVSANYELYTYTLNNPSKARRWAKHGLAGVVTDYPDRF